MIHKTSMRSLLLVGLSVLVFGAIAGYQALAPIGLVAQTGLPYQDSTLSTAERVEDLQGRMTLDQKIGQMTQVDLSYIENPQDIATYGFGSVLSGGGSDPQAGNSPQAWADTVLQFQQIAVENTALGIPLIYGTDAVHGHNNVVGATIFPHNIGLGATRDPDLVRRAAQITAEEAYATRIPWTFSPCLCVGRDERWGRSYECFGEDPELVSMLAGPAVEGYQGTDLGAPNTLLATAKHWVGDGGTEGGEDQGDTMVSEQELRSIHIPPYLEALESGVGSVMPSYSSWNGEKLHGHDYLINDVLKSELGFEGFVISDWGAIDQLPGDYASDVRTSINAGVDMVMVPDDYDAFINTLRSEVQAGRVSEARIDQAVRLILTQKFELGLFEDPYLDTNRPSLGVIGSADHRAVAREAVRKSLVLLKNEGGVLPLDDASSILVAGRNGDDVGNQCGGWTIEWQGASGEITPGTTIYEGFQEEAPAGTNVDYIENPQSWQMTGYDAGIVVVGETPYAEGQGDDADLALSSADAAAVQTVCSAMDCVVVLVSGRPMIVNEQLEQAEAFVAAWLPGTEGDGVAEVLLGDYDFRGKLPVSWPRRMSQVPINWGDAGYDPLFAYGFGLSYGEVPTPTPTEPPTPTPTEGPTATPPPTSEPTPTPTEGPTATPTPTSEGGGTCEVGYTIGNDWGSGATVSVDIINNDSAPVNSWTLEWVFPGDQQITNLWGGSYSQSGAEVEVTNGTWNASIGANGGSVNVGFNIVYGGSNEVPGQFVLNGVVCGDEPIPSPTPTQAPTVTPTDVPTATPTAGPTTTPTEGPTVTPTDLPTATPTGMPTVTPMDPPTATPTPSGATCTVNYTLGNDWGSGATVGVDVINSGLTSIDGWTLEWAFPGDQQITNLWGGSHTQSGASVEVADLGWNSTIPADGGSVNVGFNLTYSGSNEVPAEFVLNGTPCQ